MIATLVVLIATLILSLFLQNSLSLKQKLLTIPALSSIFILLYTIIGVKLYWGEDYHFLGYNYAPHINKIYQIINIFLVFLFIGHIATHYYTRTTKNKLMYNTNLIVNYKFLLIYSSTFIAYNIYSLSVGGIPIIHNLLTTLSNSLIPLIGFAVVTRTRYSTILLLSYTLLIVYLGFRYRLILLYIPIILFYFATSKIKPITLVSMTIFCVLVLIMISVVGVTRNYSSGISISEIENMDLSEIITTGLFNDTSTVLVSSAVIDYIEKNEAFAYLKQLVYILAYFIPSSLFKEKIYSPIFNYITPFSGQGDNESGLAVLGFVEYFHTAGYTGLAIFGLVLGIIFSRIHKISFRSAERFSIFSYLSLTVWLMNSFTRGYLPQNSQDLISIILGLYILRKYVIYKFNIKKIQKRFD